MTSACSTAAPSWALASRFTLAYSENERAVHAGIGVLHEWEDQIGTDDHYWRLNTYISYKRQLNPQTRVSCSTCSISPVWMTAPTTLITAEPALVVGLAQHLDLKLGVKYQHDTGEPGIGRRGRYPLRHGAQLPFLIPANMKKPQMTTAFSCNPKSRAGAHFTQEVFQRTPYGQHLGQPPRLLTTPRPRLSVILRIAVLHRHSLLFLRRLFTRLQAQQLLNTHADSRCNLLNLGTSTGHRLFLLAINQVMRLLNQGFQLRNGEGFKVNFHIKISTNESRTVMRKKSCGTLRQTAKHFNSNNHTGKVISMPAKTDTPSLSDELLIDAEPLASTAPAPSNGRETLWLLAALDSGRR
jgi:hypothetical protein